MWHLVICSLSLLNFLSCDGNESHFLDEKKAHYSKEKERCLTLIDIAKDLIAEDLIDIPEAPCSECEFIKCDERRRDCSEHLANGENKTGVYTIFPLSRLTPAGALKVYCDMETDGGGWTVIQRRGNFTPQEDFYRSWEDFKVGFGDVERDFWLGNDNIYALTNQAPVEIRFDLEDVRGNRRHAAYRNFRIGDEKHKYAVQVQRYTGDAGDGLFAHNGKNFSTRDEGETETVQELKGAWWINDFSLSHLNGLYVPGQDDPKSIHWYEWLQNEGLAFTEMKVRLK